MWCLYTCTAICFQKLIPFGVWSAWLSARLMNKCAHIKGENAGSSRFLAPFKSETICISCSRRSSPHKSFLSSFWPLFCVARSSNNGISRFSVTQSLGVQTASGIRRRISFLEAFAQRKHISASDAPTENRYFSDEARIFSSLLYGVWP